MINENDEFGPPVESEKSSITTNTELSAEETSHGHPNSTKGAAKPNWSTFDNKRRIPAFVMRFTDQELAKLKYIAETTPHSMHEYCLRAVRKALDDDSI